MKKSINELYSQLIRCSKLNRVTKQNSKDRFNTIYFGWQHAFYSHFNCLPHSQECKIFISIYGKDYRM